MATRCCSKFFLSSVWRRRLPLSPAGLERMNTHLHSLPIHHRQAAIFRLAPAREHTRALVHTSTLQLKNDEVLNEENPFYEKYSNKLDKIKGLKKSQMQAKIRAARLQETSRETAFMPSSRPSPHSQHSLLRPPSLDSVMHTEKIAEMSPEDIGKIWREYHKDKDSICAIIPAEKYKELLTKATHCPYFVYPLPRDEGYEFLFGQFSGHRCHFTSLIHYQQYQENAPVALTLTHYTDIQDTKGIVLMSGEIDTAHVTSLEAQYLANQVQLYYNSQDGERYALLRQFNHDPEKFDYHLLLEQLANSSVATSTDNAGKSQQSTHT